jgi:hypothetical protein
MIIHYMIIKSEQNSPVVDDQPFDHQGPLAQLARVSAKFSTFLPMQKRNQ